MEPIRYKVINNVTINQLENRLNEEGFEGNKVVSVTYNPIEDCYLIVIEVKNTNYNYNYNEEYNNIDNKIYKNIIKENELPVSVKWN